MKWFFTFLILISFSVHSGEWFENLKLPPYFTIKLYAKVPGARQMALSPKGNLYVGSNDQGVISVVTADGKVIKIKEGLNMPQGVLWHNNDLYLAEVSVISKILNIDETFSKNPPMLALKKDLPSDRHHGWKTIAIGPDGKLYVPVGAPCNVCDKPLPYSALHRMNLDGTNFETVARGIRNTVGFTWHPGTNLLYFTDNGRDLMGDNIPPEEINVVTKLGQHFGFPYIHGKDIKDPQFGSKIPKGLETTPPLYEIPAHSAALGIAFFPNEFYPKEFQDCFLVAEHGSWNRSKKSGYQVSKGCLKNGKVASYVPFITGFKTGETTHGRPVHFTFLKDGSFYLSDDFGGNIFHITYSRKK
jgi:glucose/arabinose dehydrogenase